MVVFTVIGVVWSASFVVVLLALLVGWFESGQRDYRLSCRGARCLHQVAELDDLWERS